MRAFRGVPARLRWPGTRNRSRNRNCTYACSLTTDGALRSDTRRVFTTEAEAEAGARRSRPTPPFAFAFDIDGVLMRMSTPIPGAAESLRRLQADRIPFILLTNGGGKHEADRAAMLGNLLGVRLGTDNLVQSHTPFRELVGPKGLEGAGGAGGLAEKTVLVTGARPGRCREIAEAYGFKNVIIPADILQAQPTVFPFDPVLLHMHAADARPLPCAPDALTVDAIFVFNDPRDWALDVQLIVDLLLSHRGRLGTLSPRNGDRALPGAGWQTDGQPTLYFSNTDMVWPARHHLPRLGQGAFHAAVEGVWSRLTGGAAGLRCVRVGKPCAGTYRFAERMLETHAARVHGGEGGSGEGSEEGSEEGSKEGSEGGSGSAVKLDRVYMVGDNPESDIRGANEYRSPRGTQWCSVLVRTGVWSPRTAADRPGHEPMATVDDVRAAVEWAMEREGRIAGA